MVNDHLLIVEWFLLLDDELLLVIVGVQLATQLDVSARSGIGESRQLVHLEEVRYVSDLQPM